MSKEEYQAKFDSYMETFKKLAKERIDDRFKLLEIEEELNKLESKAFIAASTELDDKTGKPKNTNDKMRETAKDELLSNDPEYKRLKAEKLKIQKNVEELDINIYVCKKSADMILSFSFVE